MIDVNEFFQMDTLVGASIGNLARHDHTYQSRVIHIPILPHHIFSDFYAAWADRKSVV